METGAVVLGREGRMMVLDFSVTFGASGAPIFAEAEGRRQMIGIVSASALISGRQVALTVLTESLLDSLRAQLREPS
jgi:hypothetical protein